MTTKKDLVIVILATFCLTLTLFAILPTHSSVSTSGIGEYDPWVDVDGDGEITIYDVVSVTKSYATTGDPTRNVNVTNWLPPKPKTILYSKFELQWDDNGSGFSGDAPPLYVGDYSKMSIMLKFDNVSIEHEDILCSVIVEWTGADGSEIGWGRHFYQSASTLYALRLGGWVEEISRDSYTIEGPYVTLSPVLIGGYGGSRGNATCSVYIYLASGETTDSTLKAMNWVEDRTTNDEYTLFGRYFVEGFRQITIFVESNVTCDFWVFSYGALTSWAEKDKFSISPGRQISKTYQITEGALVLRADSPSSKPWYVGIQIYVTT